MSNPPMKNGRLISIPATVLISLACGSCDKSDDAKANAEAKPVAEANVAADAEANAKVEANPMIEAAAEAQEGVAVTAALDLDAIVDQIEEGKIESAADLEASLGAESE